MSSLTVYPSRIISAF